MDDRNEHILSQRRNGRLLVLLRLAAVGVNLAGAGAARALGLPLDLNSLGTVLCAAVGGFFPAVIVGFLTAALSMLFDPLAMYYGVAQVLIALLAAWFAGRGAFKKLLRLPVPILCFALISG